ncbi:hypothetical protein [Lentzea californiensis]|uniref:hypothetical protein n=1 Tax=Lentzea californiensis TaxID=438851 RepID=UPI002165F859|nr:hypothetical protein [Lentzea californiensis]
MTNDSGDDVAYAEEHRAEWNEMAAAIATVRVEPDEAEPSVILVTMRCPRCSHQTAHVEPVVSYRTLDGVDDTGLASTSVLRDALRRAGADQRVREVLVPCGCGRPHPDRPDGRSGCGATWSLRVEWGV